MRNLLVLGVCLLPAGCATGLVFPKADGTYEIISTSATEKDALSRALRQTKRTCAQKQKSYVVLDRSVTYHGVLTQEANKLARNLSAALSLAANTPVASPATDDDYKASLLIQCVNP